MNKQMKYLTYEQIQQIKNDNNISVIHIEGTEVIKNVGATFNCLVSSNETMLLGAFEALLRDTLCNKYSKEEVKKIMNYVVDSVFESKEEDKECPFKKLNKQEDNLLKKLIKCLNKEML